MDVYPIVGKWVITIHNDCNGDEIAVTQPARGDDGGIGQRWVEGQYGASKGHRNDELVGLEGLQSVTPVAALHRNNAAIGVPDPNNLHPHLDAPASRPNVGSRLFPHLAGPKAGVLEAVDKRLDDGAS